MKILGSFATIVILLLASSARSDETDLSRLTTLFQRTFDTNYTPDQCGQNITNLIKMAKNENIDIDSGRIVVFKNRGGTELHQIAAFQAREAGEIIEAEYSKYYRQGRYGHVNFNPVPQGTKIREAGYTSWAHYHAVYLFDGHVFDYDFTNQATITKVEDYIKRMFIAKSEAEFSRLRNKLPVFNRSDSYSEFNRKTFEEMIVVKSIRPSDYPNGAAEESSLLDWQHKAQLQLCAQ